MQISRRYMLAGSFAAAVSSAWTSPQLVTFAVRSRGVSIAHPAAIQAFLDSWSEEDCRRFLAAVETERRQVIGEHIAATMGEL